jgi:hypothetical protein
VTGGDWTAIATVAIAFLGGVWGILTWVRNMIQQERADREDADRALDNKLEEIRRDHARKEDIDHLQRAISQLQTSMQTMIQLVRAQQKDD